jgi:hypothetical protein
MASYSWDTGVMTPSPEPAPIDPNDPDQMFTRALARLKANQPTFWLTERVVRPPTEWQLAGEPVEGDTWDTIEKRLDAVPRTPMACSCCEPIR